MEAVIKHVDSLGRIVLPREMRNSLNVEVGDALLVSVSEDKRFILAPMPEFKIKSVHYQDAMGRVYGVMQLQAGFICGVSSTQEFVPVFGCPLRETTAEAQRDLMEYAAENGMETVS